MHRTISHKNRMFIVAGLLLALLCSLSCVSGLPKASGAETIANSIGITAMRRNNTVYTTTDRGEFQGKTYSGYAWENLKSLQISYTGEGNIPEVAEYSYVVKVEFRRAYLSDTTSFDSDDRVTIDAAFSGTVNSLSAVPTFTYEIDPVLKDESVATFYTRMPKKEDIADTTHGFGWGIYRITLSINGYEAVSEFVAVRPTVADAAPTITYTVTSAQEGLYDAYQFSISQAHYAFIDQTCVKWYVKGETIEGKKMALLSDDLALEGFEGFDGALFETYSRDGNSFHLEIKKQGTWDVYCVVYDTDKVTTRFTSEAETIKTGEKIKTSIIIWVLVAVGVVLLGLIIFIIIKTTRKEKVW